MLIYNLHNMKKLVLQLSLALMSLSILVISTSAKAQALTEITGKRMYEHHSPTVQKPSGAPGGDQSGYDFFKHEYISSFDPATFDEYTNGEEQNIDMVEHNGAGTGQGMTFGITSGVSTIWSGDIRGNGTTKWMIASSNFNYASASDVSVLETEYNAGVADSSIEAITEGAVYIANIRNTQMYVVMRCFNVTNGTPGNDTYFDFDYKYGTAATVGFNELEESLPIEIFPNPTQDKLSISSVNKDFQVLSVVIIDTQGKIVFSQKGKEDILELDLSHLTEGIYIVQIEDEKHNKYSEKLSIR